MKQMSKKEMAVCAASCFITAISIIITIAVSVLTGNALDMAETGLLNELLLTCVILFVMSVVNNLLFTVSVYLNTTFYNTMSIKIKNQVVHNLLKNGIFNFRKKEDAYYMNLFTNDIENVAENYYGYISVFVKFLVLFLGTVIAMAMVQPWLFVVSVAFSLIPMFFSYLFETGNQKRTVHTSETNETLQGKLMQFIHSYEMLKINNINEDKAVDLIQEAGVQNAMAKRSQETFSSLTYSVLDVVSNLGNLFLIGLGGYWITTGTITVGELVSCMLLSNYIVSSTNGLLQVRVKIKSIRNIKKKIDSEMEQKQDMEWKNALKINGREVMSAEAEGNNGDLFFDDVSFSYSGGEGKNDLIQNRTCLFEKGKSYAIVGESGAGKSTFVKLMLKYHTNYRGRILYYGKEIREYTDEELYHKIGYLNQNEVILNESLYDNITLFQTNHVSQEEYEVIIRKVNLTEVAKRVKDNKLGDFGEMLSGGERQRIALARVLLRKPEILILDEPMTGLDVENQKMLNDIVFSLDGVTKIIITHDRRDEYLKQFDKIIQV